ncbi:sel1 repeat family protein [Aliikangiella marina]|uniref:Sel1 repeat family protein n=1 Tax=Aliikangiella marina TaxID=1712262 RepID=A0A545T5A6_9GAMM|nr:tetratricopeptide repeat protein [Aliikangiella marina]TQV72365.1 sel1 repeat family protein [Aliikangiella marina]
MKLIKIIFIVIALIMSFNAQSESNELLAKRAEIEAQLCGEKSCKFVFKKLRKFARNGSMHAQSVLAMLYLGGIGTEQNIEVGLKFMQKAARGGLAFAQYELGIMYLKGSAVEKNESKGRAWIQKAADAGFDKAIAFLNPQQERQQEVVVDPKDFEGEYMIVRSDTPSLTDFVAFLRAQGFGKDLQTGSHIPGRGCHNSAQSCLSWNINTNTGGNNFRNMLTRLGAYNTALEMQQRNSG